ncbi:MAG: hypothetical protein V2I97_00300, partial [Desulfococcaceae bacterium]|nr:hypothetical protein [Desulfococcaceae bacterium]
FHRKPFRDAARIQSGVQEARLSFGRDRQRPGTAAKNPYGSIREECRSRLSPDDKAPPCPA